MFLKAWCELALLVAMLVESLFEKVLCKDAHLWEAMHAPLYFGIDGTVVVGQVCEVLEFDKIGREVAEFHAHEFRLVHWCVKVKILQIDGAVACILC
jgi:hypothetical protein